MDIIITILDGMIGSVFILIDSAIRFGKDEISTLAQVITSSIKVTLLLVLTVFVIIKMILNRGVHGDQNYLILLGINGVGLLLCIPALIMASVKIHNRNKSKETKDTKDNTKTNDSIKKL